MTSTRGDGVIGSDDIAVLIGKRLCLRELCRLSGQNGVHFSLQELLLLDLWQA